VASTGRRTGRDTAFLGAFATTAKRQGKDPLALFKTILLNGANTQVTELYAPENLPKANTS